MTATAEAFLANWFPQDMLERADEVVAPFRGDLLALDRHGLAGCLAAVRDADMRRTIALITAPTLVIAGANDTVTRPEHGELIAATLPGAELVTLQAVHLSNIECADDFMRALLASSPLCPLPDRPAYVVVRSQVRTTSAARGSAGAALPVSTSRSSSGSNRRTSSAQHQLGNEPTVTWWWTVSPSRDQVPA